MKSPKKPKKHAKSFETLDEVVEQEVEFLFFPYIIFGMINVIEGDPNVGKSFFATWLACIVSTGGLLPNEQHASKGRVLYLSAEDDPAYTIKPRVTAMGGDANRIHYMKFDLLFDEAGLDQIYSECRTFGIDVVVIDPLISFMPRGKDLHNSTDIREVLGHLKRLAQDTRVAIVIVRHHTKSRRDKAIYQGQGTIDLVAAARSVGMIAPHPDVPELRVLAHVKYNLSERGPSYAFRLVPSNERNRPPAIKWEGVADLTPEELLSIDPPDVSAVDRAVEFLRESLKAGPTPAKTVLKKAEPYAISGRTIDRAKKELGVVVAKAANGWLWSLPKSKPKSKGAKRR